MRVFYCASWILQYTGFEICVIIKLLNGFYGLKNKVGDKGRATSNSTMKLNGYDTWKSLRDSAAEVYVFKN
jgi:hypothetical protein